MTDPENKTKLRDLVSKFDLWVKNCSAQSLRTLIQDAFWKHDQSFGKSELVRYFLLELAGHQMVHDGLFKRRMAVLKKKFGPN